MSILVCLGFVSLGVLLNVSTFLLGYGFGISKKIVEQQATASSQRSREYWHSPVPFDRN